MEGVRFLGRAEKGKRAEKKEIYRRRLLRLLGLESGLCGWMLGWTWFARELRFVDAVVRWEWFEFGTVEYLHRRFATPLRLTTLFTPYPPPSVISPEKDLGAFGPRVSFVIEVGSVARVRERVPIPYGRDPTLTLRSTGRLYRPSAEEC